MLLIKKIKRMQKMTNDIRREGKIIGFVPTMGYLHEGHLSLMKIARKQCDILVVSIFVNPTQFAPDEDLDKYPKNFARDKQLCEKEQVDFLFYPNPAEMYTIDYLTYVNVSKITETMCGASRPIHFRGVTTVVCKLFHIVKPHLTVFGQKDFQQILTIKRMVKDLNFDIEIIMGPIIREKDGLALSSRNKYLNVEERKQARELFNSLKLAVSLIKKGTTSATAIKNQIKKYLNRIPDLTIDYIAIVDSESLEEVKEIENKTLIALAVFLGSTRLIDNVLIHLPD